MKKFGFEFVNIFAAVRTAGALIAGNGVVQWYLGAPGVVVVELLVSSDSICFICLPKLNSRNGRGDRFVWNRSYSLAHSR